MLVGIDLTSSERKATACAALSPEGSLHDLGFVVTDDDIAASCSRHRADVVAIDAPLGLPQGMHCLEEDCPCRPASTRKGRACERELAAMGIPLYFTTERSFIKSMIKRAMRLAADLRREGHVVVEVYPQASKVILFGRPVPKKTTSEGLAFLKRHLSERVPGVAERAVELDHNLCDALVAAYTGYLYSRGETLALGLEEEARIVVPRTA